MNGEKLKALGIELVSANAGDWMDDAQELLRAYCSRTVDEFAIEDFKLWARTLDLPEPHHPNAWGALSRTMNLSHWARPTGRWRKSFHAKAHARKVPIYLSLIARGTK